IVPTRPNTRKTSSCSGPPWSLSAGENPVDSRRQPPGADAVEMQRDDRAARAVGYAVDRLAVEIALGDVSSAIDAGLHRAQFSVRLPEALLGELSLGHAVGAPDLVAVHRALLAGQPGDRGDDEVAFRIHVQH